MSNELKPYAPCREALIRYGRHLPSCEYVPYDGSDISMPHPCTCGLTRAIEAARRTPPPAQPQHDYRQPCVKCGEPLPAAHIYFVCDKCRAEAPAQPQQGADIRSLRDIKAQLKKAAQPQDMSVKGEDDPTKFPYKPNDDTFAPAQPRQQKIGMTPEAEAFNRDWEASVKAQSAQPQSEGIATSGGVFIEDVPPQSEGEACASCELLHEIIEAREKDIEQLQTQAASAPPAQGSGRPPAQRLTLGEWNKIYEHAAVTCEPKFVSEFEYEILEHRLRTVTPQPPPGRVISERAWKRFVDDIYQLDADGLDDVAADYREILSALRTVTPQPSL